MSTIFYLYDKILMSQIYLPQHHCSWAPAGGGGREEALPPLENKENFFFRYTGGAFVTFSLCGDHFATFSPYGGGGVGLFHHVGTFLLLYFPCEGFFVFMGAFLGLPTKISASAHTMGSNFLLLQ